ncbi:membrane protein YczE [Tsukamurella soli]|uniref:Membrane protein n=1 Tax=Tsukamurella soli TaxID=644556 RepID=A0ABP8K5E9_9ACTN
MRLTIRLVRLALGLFLYGASEALLIASGLGNIPWDVLNQGVARHLGVSIGAVVIGGGALVLLLWIPLRQRPGFGTVANVVTLGLALNLVLGWLPRHPGVLLGVAMMVVGIALNAIATVLYIGAGFGAGPRDGLMTGLVARTGWSIRVVRTALEVIVVVIGFALGGTLGVGTVLYAVGVGPLIQLVNRTGLFGSVGAARPRMPVDGAPVAVE